MQSFGSLVVLLWTKIKSLLAQILSTVLLQISFLHLTFWFPDFHILSWCSGDAACWKRTMCNTKHQTTQEKRQETVENSLLNLTLLDDLVYVKCYRSSASLLFLIGMLMYNPSWEQWGSGSTRVVSERVCSLSRVELLFSCHDSYDAANSPVWFFIPSAKKDGTMKFRSEVFVPGGLWQSPCEADQPRTDTVELRWLCLPRFWLEFRGKEVRWCHIFSAWRFWRISFNFLDFLIPWH